MVRFYQDNSIYYIVLREVQLGLSDNHFPLNQGSAFAHLNFLLICKVFRRVSD